MRYCLEPGVHSTCRKVILISTQSVYFVLVVPTGNPGIQVVQVSRSGLKLAGQPRLGFCFHFPRVGSQAPHLDNFYRSYFLPFWREVYLGEGASFEEYGSNFISSQITKQLFQPIMRSLILLLGLQMPFYHILKLNINLSIFFNIFKIH